MINEGSNIVFYRDDCGFLCRRWSIIYFRNIARDRSVLITDYWPVVYRSEGLIRITCS